MRNFLIQTLALIAYFFGEQNLALAAPNGFADVVEPLLPTVVSISSTQEFSNNGSGFIISQDGYIATNAHVVEDAKEINVSLANGTKYKAKIAGTDKKTDLAVIKINTDKTLPFTKFGDSTKSRIGDWIIIIGNPYGLGGSVSAGIISARGRSINSANDDRGEDLIQTDAAINKGNSGGPMFNTQGEVIGVNTALFSPSGGSVGIGFANPSSISYPIIKQLMEQGEVIRGWIGIAVQPVTEQLATSVNANNLNGAFVSDITENGPANKAGIVPSDIIIKFGDQEITEMKMLPKLVIQSQVGKNIPVTIMRRGKIKILNVRIGKLLEEKTALKKVD